MTTAITTLSGKGFTLHIVHHLAKEMSVNNGAIQLGLLPNMDTPVSQFRQRKRVTKNVTGALEQDLSARTQGELLQHISSKVVEAQQSYPDSTTVRLPSEWERSQEFEINVGNQKVRVNFRAFYLRCGVHHARVFWTQY